MIQYRCRKPCKIGGKRYSINDVVESGAIAPGREQTLIGYGLITEERAADPLADPPTNPVTDPPAQNAETPTAEPAAPTSEDAAKSEQKTGSKKKAGQ